jgi:crossover junction endodeoxyribonuclease RuvC
MVDLKIHKYRALGVDPGLAETGYAVIGTCDRGGEACEWGCFKTSPKLTLPHRLQIIYQNVEAVIKKWQPTILILEEVYVLPQFPKAAIQLGEVRGIIYLASQQSDVSIMKIRPTEIKNSLTGHGRATKDQIRRSVRRILQMEDEITPDHASDAAALAITGLSRKGYYKW